MKSKNSVCSGFLCALLFLNFGCASQQRPKNPPGYDLKNPVMLSLPKNIDQISGIVYQDSSVFAIDDDHGDLYKIPLRDAKSTEEWRFGKKKDFEDLVQLGDFFYVLNSDGELVTFKLPPTETKSISSPASGRNEFETLFADKGGKRLFMVCKNCAADKSHLTSVYQFNAASGRFEDSKLTIDGNKIEKLASERTGKFRPSAGAMHPQTGDIFLVSSINKLLVVTGSDFDVKAVYRLDPKLFKQPEGLCFMPNGDLLISNEAAGKGSANILIFRYGQKD